MKLQTIPLKKILGYALLLFISTKPITGNAQRIDTLINDYSLKFPIERVHLHFDRPNYAPKDTIWFKAYILSGILPDNMSKSLYVDFSDENGKVIAHNVYPMAEGTSRGQFAVPDSLKGNLIHIKAYTKWMLNFDSSFLFNKNINIIQSKPKRIKGKPPVAKTSLYFFPEGGDAVAGINGRIAFMAENQYGQPVPVSGVVKDKEGNEVAELKPIHDGMGSFNIIPKQNEQYTATWKDIDGSTKTTALPPIKNSGVTITILPNTGHDIFAIQRTDDVPDNLKSLHIIATMYQQLVYMANISLLDKNMVSGSIPTAQFPSGIIQVTVFDKNWIPLAERIVYVKNQGDLFTPEVGFAKLNFDRRGQNELVINVLDSVSANLSVSVTDASVGTDSSNNLVSSMLLSSQIKGHIFKPYYYFSDSTAEIARNLDLVMLTHGWRRFNWDKLFHNIDPVIKFPRDTSYMTLSGKVFGATSAQIAASGALFTLLKTKSDTSGKMDMIALNADGSFEDPRAIFFDSLQVYYKFAGKRDYFKNAEVTFMPNRLPSPNHIAMNLDEILKARLYDTSGLAAGENLYDKYWASAHFDNSVINTVAVTTRVKSPTEVLDDKYTSGMFKGGDARSFDVMNDISAQGSFNVFSYLQGRVAGLQISNPQSDPPGMTWRGSTPSLFLDEVPVSDASQVSNLSMSDIAYIKVFPPPFMGGFGGSPGGGIAIYTRRGGDVQREKGEGLPYKTIAGYSLIKEFYSPDYLSLSENHDKEDVRSTLYWNSLILTDPQNHEVRLKFFNNDFSKAFRIVLEGINTNGQFTHIEKVIQ